MGYPEHLRTQVDAYLAEVEFTQGADLAGLSDAMRYSLLAPGSESDRCWRWPRRSRSAASRRR